VKKRDEMQVVRVSVGWMVTQGYCVGLLEKTGDEANREFTSVEIKVRAISHGEK